MRTSEMIFGIFIRSIVNSRRLLNSPAIENVGISRHRSVRLWCLASWRLPDRRDNWYAVQLGMHQAHSILLWRLMLLGVWATVISVRTLRTEIREWFDSFVSFSNKCPRPCSSPIIFKKMPLLSFETDEEAKCKCVNYSSFSF